MIVSSRFDRNKSWSCFALSHLRLRFVHHPCFAFPNPSSYLCKQQVISDHTHFRLVQIISKHTHLQLYVLRIFLVCLGFNNFCFCGVILNKRHGTFYFFLPLKLKTWMKGYCSSFLVVHYNRKVITSTGWKQPTGWNDGWMKENSHPHQIWSFAFSFQGHAFL